LRSIKDRSGVRAREIGLRGRGEWRLGRGGWQRGQADGARDDAGARGRLAALAATPARE